MNGEIELKSMPNNGSVFSFSIKFKTCEKSAIKEYGEIGVKHAFIAYTDSVLNNIENPQKFLPYFFANPDGYFGVIAEYLDKFNMNYGHKKN